MCYPTHPFTSGHISLVHTALNISRQLVKADSQAHTEAVTEPLAVFEIAVVNADKPPLPREAILSRSILWNFLSSSLPSTLYSTLLPSTLSSPLLPSTLYLPPSSLTLYPLPSTLPLTINPLLHSNPSLTIYPPLLPSPLLPLPHPLTQVAAIRVITSDQLCSSYHVPASVRREERRVPLVHIPDRGR